MVIKWPFISCYFLWVSQGMPYYMDFACLIFFGVINKQNMYREFNSAFFLANGPWFKHEGKCCKYKHQEIKKHGRINPDDCKQKCLGDKKCRAYETINWKYGWSIQK